MSGNGGGKMPPDPRLVFQPINNGRSGAKRAILSSDLVYYDPVVKTRDWPELIEFALKPDRAWLFGPYSKFEIRGKFVREVYQAEQPAVGEVGQVGYVAAIPEQWVPQDAGALDRARFMLAPNWWELLIKSFRVYHKNVDMKTTNELDSMKPIVNALLYVNMDEEAKTNLGVVQCHPVFGIDPLRGNYGSAAVTDQFIAYSQAVFNGEFQFTWTPMHTFPFWQGTQYPVDQYGTKIVPFHYCKNGIDIQMLMHRDQQIIYKKAEGVRDRLKFELIDIRLAVEEANLGPQIEKYFTRGKVFKYQGVTRQATAENVQAGVMSHKIKFQDIYQPEGIIIFAAPKKVVAGTYSYNDGENPLRSLLSDHHIQEVKVSFGGKDFFHKEPHSGQLMEPIINYKHMMDYLHSPPFGLKMNPKLFTLDRIRGGCAASSHPHVYINLRNTKDGERLTPVHEDGSITAMRKDLEITLLFNPDGAEENVTYFVYTWYADTYMEMHLLPDRDAVFVNPYMQKI
jgi:hypothetical protein